MHLIKNAVVFNYKASFYGNWLVKSSVMDIDRLFKNIRSRLYNFIANRVDNKEDAKDILQNVFVKVVEKADTLKDVNAKEAWVYQIARNAVVDYYRKSKYKVFNNRLDENKLSELNITQKIESAKAVTTELDTCIHALINQLPNKYRHIIYMTEIKGMKQHELAKQLNMPSPTLRSRVQRGRAKLKELMQQNCCYNIGYCDFLNKLDRSSCNVCKDPPSPNNDLTFFN